MWSWWLSLSLETLQTVNSVALWIIGIFGVITALAVVISTMASTRIDELKDQNLSTLQRQLSDMRTHQTPRTISTTQQKQFLKLAETIEKGHVTVAQPLNDHEASKLAESIGRMLQEAGWAVTMTVSMGISANTTGIILLFKDEASAPPFMVPLRDAFEAVGLSVEIMRNPRGSPELEIIVAHKPT